MLTTATTIVGLTPMMLERSIQAKFLTPIVVSLVFGVFCAFFVTLLMVPAMYAIGVDVSTWRARIRQKVKDRLSHRRATPNESAQGTGQASS
jgi:predicted RND superfamily exporter protein